MSIYKHYEFVCENCEHSYKAGMWTNRDGEDEGSKCPTCEHVNFPVITEEQKAFMINTLGGAKGADWQKGLNSDWKSFMKEFKKRHGRDSTIADYSNGRTEY